MQWTIAAKFLAVHIWKIWFFKYVKVDSTVSEKNDTFTMIILGVFHAEIDEFRMLQKAPTTPILRRSLSVPRALYTSN